MKRMIILLGILSVVHINAESFTESLKELSKYRTVSALKACGTSLLMYYTVKAAVGHGGKCDISEFQKTVENAIPTLGLSYVTWELGWNWLKPQLQHALAIK